MPQIFYKLPDLVNVDWDTIVIHTCTNTACLPDFQNDEYYLEEHAYVQLSSDFSKVKYGTEQQIADQKNLKAQQLQEEQKAIEENKEEIDKLKAESEAQSKGEGKKKNKKKNKKAKEDQVSTQEVNNEVQEGLGDLLNSMNLGNN